MNDLPAAYRGYREVATMHLNVGRTWYWIVVIVGTWIVLGTALLLILEVLGLLL